MSTFTSRLQLEKPNPSDTMSNGASVLTANYLKIDVVAGAPLFTSITRPAAPFSGQLIAESDTGDKRFWNGTKWAFLGNDVYQRELDSLDTSSISLTTTAEAIFRQATFDAVAGRRYRIDFATYGEVVPNNTGRFINKIRWANGLFSSTADTLLYSNVIQCNSVGVTGKSVRDFCELNYTGISGPISIGWYMESIDGFGIGFGVTTDGMDVDTSFAVRDWGD